MSRPLVGSSPFFTQAQSLYNTTAMQDNKDENSQDVELEMTGEDNLDEPIWKTKKQLQ